MRDSVSTLESLSGKDEGLIRPIALELNSLFSEALTGGYKVQQAWCDIGVGRMTEILTQIRSRLLDFLLELSEKVGDQMSDEEVKRVGQSPETASMFNHAIFGDNVTILVGNQSRQTVTNQIIHGDFASLETLLQEHRVPSSDIAELKSAIEADADSADLEAKQFGPKVRDWMKKMLGKVVDTSWRIELGIASNLLTDALRTYYGW